jgi:hypothetical protein
VIVGRAFYKSLVLMNRLYLLSRPKLSSERRLLINNGGQFPITPFQGITGRHLSDKPTLRPSDEKRVFQNRSFESGPAHTQ